jgi:hypothetical protein
VYIYEIVFYSGSLTTSQRQQIEGYLSWKWGLIPRFQNPTSIPGSILWLDAADSTVFNGGAIWTDKSGTNNHAVNGTPGASAMPTVTTWTNGLTAARFVTASKNSMKTTNTIPNLNVTYFVVVRMNDVTALGRIMINNVDGQRQINASANFPSTIYGYGSGTAAQANMLSVTQSQAFQVCLTVASGSTGFIGYGNGTLGGNTNTSTSSPSKHYFGSADSDGGYMSGDIAEVIIYNTVLSTIQRQQVEGYLADKWGLRASLPGSFPTLFPTSHPFYRSLPYTRAFNPLDIGGCSLWLDGGDGTSVTLSGSNVTQWNDKSGNSRHATQTTSGLRPTYTSNFINFNGASYLNMTDAFNMLSSTGRYYTTFIVERRRAAGGGQFPLAGGGSTGGNMMAIGYNADTVWRHTYATISDLDYTVPAYGNPDPIRVWSAGYNGALRDTYLDGAFGVSAAYSTGMTDWVQPVIGYLPLAGINSYYTGEIYEILFYNSYLSTSDRQQVENYLTWKWGVAPQIASPTEIAGCQLWLDGRDPNGNGILPSAGATVTTWVDKSGSGNSMTASGTPTFQISPSRISLNGSSYLQKLSSLSNAVYTSFYVYQQTSSSGPLFTTNATSSYTGLFANEGGTAYVCRSDSSWFTKTNAIPNNQINLLTVQYDASGNIYVWLNGVLNIQTTTAGAITRDRLTLGVRLFNNQYMTGSYYEVIQMNSTLANAQRQQVEKYLARKWNIQGTSNIPPRTTAFAPPQLSNLSVWLDAADSAQVTLSGSNVTAWADKSSNALSMQSGARPTYASNSLNGLPVVSFTTTQNLSSTTTMTLSPSNTWALVFNSPTGGNFFMAEHSSNINNVQGSYFLGVNFDLYAMNRTGVLSTWKRYQDSSGQGVPPFNTNTWYIAIVSDNNTNGGVFFRRNGVTRAISNVNSFTALTGDITSNFFINHRLSANVNFGEILVYNRGLSLAEVQTLEGYLANKWGLQGSLPSTHPYVKITP